MDRRSGSGVVDVAIVGGGIAGLAVTELLVAAGLDVVCLETRGRVGGRLLTKPVEGGGLDLGATWFWPGERRIAALVERLGVATHEQYRDGDAVYDRPGAVQRLEGNPVDVPARRFTSGAQGVADAVAGRLPDGALRLGVAVRAVRAARGGVTLDTTASAVRAAHAVMAVPPALAVTSIEFTPALPEHVLGLARTTPVWMGATTKVVAQYDEPFWRASGLSGAAISHVGPLREIHDMSGPQGRPAALFGFAPGAGPAPLRTSAVLDQLVRLFGPRAAKPRQVLVQNWRTARNTSPPAVEALRAYQLFGHELYRQPALNGRLHWATTETSFKAAGHIEGALAAAEHVSDALIHALNAADARAVAEVAPTTSPSWSNR